MQELKKKVILLRNFKSYMTADALERKDRRWASARVSAFVWGMLSACEGFPKKWLQVVQGIRLWDLEKSPTRMITAPKEALDLHGEHVITNMSLSQPSKTMKRMVELVV